MSAPVVEFVQPNGLFVPTTRSSHIAVVGGVGRWAFVKGQLGIDANRRLVEGGMCGQAERAYRNVQTALNSVGAGLTDVVKFTVYVSRYGPEELAAILEARQAVFPLGWLPPSTLIVVAGFVLPGALIEVEAIAAFPPVLRLRRRRRTQGRRTGGR